MLNPQDKNPDSRAQAEAKFKAISEAYEVSVSLVGAVVRVGGFCPLHRGGVLACMMMQGSALKVLVGMVVRAHTQ